MYFLVVRAQYVDGELVVDCFRVEGLEARKDDADCIAVVEVRILLLGS